MKHRTYAVCAFRAVDKARHDTVKCKPIKCSFFGSASDGRRLID